MKGRPAGVRRSVLFAAGAILPPSRLKNRFLNIFSGVSVHRSAIVGHVLVYNTDRLVLGPRARLGNLTVIRNLLELRLGECSTIGTLNLITSAPAFNSLPDDGVRGRLLVGRESAVTSRHYFDCSGGVSIGAFSVIAGCRSTILTHQVDLESNRQVIMPVSVGERCFISSNVSVVPGAACADRIVVAMGAVVKGDLDLVGQLYGGVPAKALGPARNEGFVGRDQGAVGVEVESSSGAS